PTPGSSPEVCTVLPRDVTLAMRDPPSGRGEPSTRSHGPPPFGTLAGRERHRDDDPGPATRRVKPRGSARRGVRRSPFARPASAEPPPGAGAPLDRHLPPDDARRGGVRPRGPRLRHARGEPVIDRGRPRTLFPRRGRLPERSAPPRAGFARATSCSP